MQHYVNGSAILTFALGLQDLFQTDFQTLFSFLTTLTAEPWLTNLTADTFGKSSYTENSSNEDDSF